MKYLILICFLYIANTSYSQDIQAQNTQDTIVIADSLISKVGELEFYNGRFWNLISDDQKYIFLMLNEDSILRFSLILATRFENDSTFIDSLNGVLEKYYTDTTSFDKKVYAMNEFFSERENQDISIVDCFYLTILKFNGITDVEYTERLNNIRQTWKMKKPED